VHVLGELVRAGTISVALSQAVRLVRIVLDYRVRCMEIELRREQLGLTPGSQPASSLFPVTNTVFPEGLIATERAWLTKLPVPL
jgi:hypothetical protein